MRKNVGRSWIPCLVVSSRDRAHGGRYRVRTVTRSSTALDEEHALLASAGTCWIGAYIRCPLRDFSADRRDAYGSVGGRSPFICLVFAKPHVAGRDRRMDGSARSPCTVGLLVI